MKNFEMVDFKTKAAVRVKPGDRWKCVLNGANEKIVFESLTETLEYIYQLNGSSQFFIDAKESVIYVMSIKNHTIAETSDKKYSIYDEN